MSVKVNLLPAEVGQRSRAGRQRALTGAAFGLLAVAIGAGWFWNQGRIDAAEVELAEAEAEVALLQGELAELEPFAELEARRVAGEDLLAVTLGDEVSVAGVLQDFSSVFPPNAEVEAMSVLITGDREPLPGGERIVVGSVSASGKLLLGVSPGAERLLIDVSRAAAFDNVFVSTRADDEGAYGFDVDFELGPEVLTDRYAGSEPATVTTTTTTEVAP